MTDAGTTLLWRPTGPAELELWVPAEELDEFNTHIVGLIDVVHEFR
ncbi:hypothetical protein ACTMSW_21995 [Micromonospora sp. BQ11]